MSNTQTQPGRIVVIGDALIDELRDGASSREFVGGAGLNVAVGLAILGVPTTLVAMIGADADGERIRLFLADVGVDLAATIGPDGSSRAVSDRTAGEPRYAFNRAAQRRSIDFGAAARAVLDAADYVVVSCFPFDDAAQVAALEDAVRRPHRRLIIDPNPRRGMLSSAAEFAANADRVAGRSLLCKVGDDDAALVYGIGLDRLAQRLLHAGTGAILATAGQGGARITTGGRCGNVTVDAPILALPGPVIDTMGAGDATLASVVASFVADGVPHDTPGWQAVLERAMAIAAATCRHEGALLRLPPGALPSGALPLSDALPPDALPSDVLPSDGAVAD